MCKKAGVQRRALACRALLCSFVLMAGCGDADTSAVNGDENPAISLGAALNGARVLLFRSSSRCGSFASPPLVAVLGAEVEFAPERTETLRPSCEDDSRPGIVVDVEEGSVVFDFSNVLHPGAFSSSGFDGYVLQFLRHCGDPILTSAAFDSDHSDIPIGASALSTHYDRVEVNFARVAYDAETFAKVDLGWAEVDCLIDPAD